MYRGFGFIVAHACHLGFQRRVHPLVKLDMLPLHPIPFIAHVHGCYKSVQHKSKLLSVTYNARRGADGGSEAIAPPFLPNII